MTFVNENDNGLDEKLLELSALFEISRTITSSLSIQAIIENILRIPMGHLLINKGVVLLQKDESNIYCIEEIKGLDRALKGKCIRIVDPPISAKLIKEIDSDAEWVDFFRTFGIKIILPLNTGSNLIGFVGYGPKVGNRKFLDSELEFLNSLSNIAATAVSNGINVEKIKQVNRNLDHKVQQLSDIFDISQEMTATLDRNKIGSIVAFAIMGQLMVNKCAIFFKEKGSFNLVTCKGLSSEVFKKLDIPPLVSPVSMGTEKEWQEIKAAGFQLLVPMRLQEESVGIIALGPKTNKNEFNANDIDFVKILGNQAAASLENLRLFNETLEKQRMEEELKLARTMQQALLPSDLPGNKFCEFAAVNIPSREVGGDYYDVIPLGENRWAVAIADVVGKGAGAALLMANLQASLNVLVHEIKDVADMTGRINRLIYKNTAMDKFITFFFCVIDTEKNLLKYCNAGHNPPYKLSSSGDVTELTEGGIVLGMMENIEYNQGEVEFKPGDKVVMFTDGITEAMDADEQEFGDDRLKDLILKNRNKTSSQLLEIIVQRVKDFQYGDVQADDITLVIAGRLVK